MTALPLPTFVPIFLAALVGRAAWPPAPRR